MQLALALPYPWRAGSRGLRVTWMGLQRTSVLGDPDGPGCRSPLPLGPKPRAHCPTSLSFKLPSHWQNDGYVNIMD